MAGEGLFVAGGVAVVVEDGSGGVGVAVDGVGDGPSIR